MVRLDTSTTRQPVFTAKVFQLHLRLPDVEIETTERFSRHVLELKDRHPVMAPFDGDRFNLPLENESIAGAAGFDAMAEVVRTAQLRGASPADQRTLQESLAHALATPNEQKAVAHRLEPFFGLLDPNPRSVVRFVNAMSVEVVVNSVREQPANFDQMARWTVVEQRWPLVAVRLRASPGLVDALVNGETPEAAESEAERAMSALMTSAQFRRVLRSDGPRPLDSDGIRACCGLTAEADGDANSARLPDDD